jgi:hypothetical protein
MGRGRPINQLSWPPTGTRRSLLEFLDTVHRRNGMPSQRTIARVMHLSSPSVVGDILRGHRDPADEAQLVLLVQAIGGTRQDEHRAKALFRAVQVTCADSAGTPPAWWRRSGYLRRVHDLAPPQLHDRADELARLAAFCAGPESYLRVLAEPWAGKTALLAWFVLHPPPGTDVVSFFVTARDASQSTSEACTDALIEQLAALTGDRADVSPASVSARDAVRRRLLTHAAAGAARGGRRLVLVIDGIDEDRGTRPGLATASIVSLLPRRPDDAVRIVVAGRPDPPLPDDVSPGHPLPAAETWHLPPSRHASELGLLARRELDGLLHGGPDLAREVIGLLVAAGGGLAPRDLEEITGRAPYEIRALVGSIAGRTVRQQRGALQFAHETLRETSRESLGDRGVARHRERLHIWADSYRLREWPADTPAYLIHDYGRMVRVTGDARRMVRLATDSRRQSLLHTATDSDLLAFDEVRSAQDLMLRQADPDLLAAARLAVHRRVIEFRSSVVAADLAAVWARLGQPVQAEALARTVVDPGRRSWALTEVSMLTSAHGRKAEAVTLAESIPLPAAREYALAAIADTGQTDENPADDYPARVLSELAVAWGMKPGPPRPAPATTVLSGLVDRTRRGRVRHDRITAWAEIAARVSPPQHAERIAQRAQDVARHAIVEAVGYPELSALAAALERIGDTGRTAFLVQAGGSEVWWLDDSPELPLPPGRRTELPAFPTNRDRPNWILPPGPEPAGLFDVARPVVHLPRADRLVELSGDGFQLRNDRVGEELTPAQAVHLARQVQVPNRPAFLAALACGVAAAGRLTEAARIIDAAADALHYLSAAERAEAVTLVADADEQWRSARATANVDHHRTEPDDIAQALYEAVDDVALLRTLREIAPSPVEQVGHLLDAAQWAWADGFEGQTASLLRHAETAAGHVGDPWDQVQALLQIVPYQTADPAAVTRLCDRAIDQIAGLPTDQAADLLSLLLEALAAIERHDLITKYAEALIRADGRWATLRRVLAAIPSTVPDLLTFLAGSDFFALHLRRALSTMEAFQPDDVEGLTSAATAAQADPDLVSRYAIAAARAGRTTRAERLMSGLLTTSDWQAICDALSVISPSALRAMADELATILHTAPAADT